MRLWNIVFSFYLDASVHVALAVLALTYVSAENLNIPIDGRVPIFLFFGTIACYNFIKYGVEAKKYLLVANNYHKGIQWFSIICFALATAQVVFFSYGQVIVIGGLLVLVGCYALPLLPGVGNLRNWAGVKVYVVALVWAVTTVILPTLPYLNDWPLAVFIELAQRFILVLLLLIPFEIRDLAYDDKALSTLPQRFGVTGTRYLGYTGCVLLLALCLFRADGDLELYFGYTALAAVLGFTIMRTNRNNRVISLLFTLRESPYFGGGF